MSMREDILAAQKTALKDGNSEKLSVLRFLWSAVRNEEIDKKKDLNDAEIQQIVARQIKQLKDALQDFAASNRQDLVVKNKMEIDLLEKYLPAQMADDELQKIVDQVIAGMGTVTAGDTGKVIGAVMKQIAGRADGGRVKTIVMEKLAKDIKKI
ncbi:MAG: GatB/YqeY domain-containing protein [Candidatus Magasanikbacteria bacterium]|nr:GatB/YqeY domain-containing protein [Candidatus Magasanikbacteria bacterium]